MLCCDVAMLVESEAEVERWHYTALCPHSLGSATQHTGNLAFFFLLWTETSPMEPNLVMFVSQYHKLILLLLIRGTLKDGSSLCQELIVFHLDPGASEVLAFVSPNHLRSQRCKFNFLFV